MALNEIIEKFARLGDATSAGKKFRETADGFSAIGPNFTGEAIGLFSFGGVVVVGEKHERKPAIDLQLGSSAGDFNPAMLSGDGESANAVAFIFLGENLFWCIRKLAGVLQPSSNICKTVLEDTVAIRVCECRQAVGV